MVKLHAAKPQARHAITKANCSTWIPQPYSISIRVQEYLSRNPGRIFDAQLVATDPSPAVLADFNRGLLTAIICRPPVRVCRRQPCQPINILLTSCF
jgi:chemotaxis methyl-accepting protein methylase